MERVTAHGTQLSCSNYCLKTANFLSTHGNNSSIQDGYVSWHVVVVSPVAQTTEQWTELWMGVSEELQISYVGYGDKVTVVEDGSELKALDEKKDLGERKAQGVQTGRWKNLEAAVEISPLTYPK
jgi:hypothetical protein